MLCKPKVAIAKTKPIACEWWGERETKRMLTTSQGCETREEIVRLSVVGMIRELWGEPEGWNYDYDCMLCLDEYCDKD